MTAGTPAPTPGDPTTTLPEDRKRMEADAQADAQQPGVVKTSRTGAVMGRPDAEHGMYGMVREDAEEAKDATEPQIRGVESGKPPPA